MEKLVDDGLVKQIGISNFSCKKIDDLLSYARIKPAVLQVEVHPYFRNQQVVDHCKTKVACHCGLAEMLVLGASVSQVMLQHMQMGSRHVLVLVQLNMLFRRHVNT